MAICEIIDDQIETLMNEQMEMMAENRSRHPMMGFPSNQMSRHEICTIVEF